jgi:hypothetical protein
LTKLQRAWTAFSFIFIAVFVAWYFLEWAGYSTANEFSSRLVLPFYNTTVPIDCPVDASSPSYQRLCSDGKTNLVIVNGLYVRFGRSVELAFFFGALMPILLVIAAGFALIRRSIRR